MIIKHVVFSKSKIFVCFVSLSMVFAMLITSSAKSSLAQSCEYWVATAGSNSNPGTFSQPWATMDHAAATVPDNHCTVWFKSGVYVGHNEPERRFNTPTTFKAVEPYTAVFQHNDIVLELDGNRHMIFDGFVFRHSGPGSSSYVVIGGRSSDGWLEHITFRNNIFHDSYDNDLLKIHNGSRFITVENNIFFNQGDSEQDMDVNSVTDVVIQDNIFFHDFAGSGREPFQTKAFIVVKDSNEGEDGLLGSERVTIRRNIFMNWEGDPGEHFLAIGNDGKPYHEAKDVQIENNLFIGNTNNETHTILGVRGSKNVTFVNNTITGDLPSSSYAFRIETIESNPQNENIFFYNNIWSDPTGTMGEGPTRGGGDFSDGEPSTTINAQLDNNLYWNGGSAIPSGEFFSPLVDDAHRIVANPLLNTNQNGLILPRWQGSAFPSGNITIRQEFLRLVEQYGSIPINSPAVGEANSAYTPVEDILGNPRDAASDMGAYEISIGPSVPVVTVVGPGKMGVSWYTNEVATGMIEYGTSPGNYTQTLSDSAFTTQHYFVLSGLTLGQRYYFRVSNTFQSNDPYQSIEYSFVAQTAVYLPLITR
jgi:hypothetical protein